MITERDIAEKFTVLWRQQLPMLTPNFMRVFNESQIKVINNLNIPVQDDVRYDLVSEFSFNVASNVANGNMTTDEFLANDTLVRQLTIETARSIWKQGTYLEDTLTLNEIEIKETKLICLNILEFINKVKNWEFQFKPQLKGYGVIPDLQADISIDKTLYEIKTVNRNFRSSDLKQLFIYLALKHATGSTKWDFGGLYNPRRGQYCRFSIKSLIYTLSGGKSTTETFEGILNSLTRDIELDSRF